MYTDFYVSNFLRISSAVILFLSLSINGLFLLKFRLYLSKNRPDLYKKLYPYGLTRTFRILEFVFTGQTKDDPQLKKLQLPLRIASVVTVLAFVFVHHMFMSHLHEYEIRTNIDNVFRSTVLSLEASNTIELSRLYHKAKGVSPEEEKAKEKAEEKSIKNSFKLVKAHLGKMKVVSEYNGPVPEESDIAIAGKPESYWKTYHYRITEKTYEFNSEEAGKVYVRIELCKDKKLRYEKVYGIKRISFYFPDIKDEKIISELKADLKEP